MNIVVKLRIEQYPEVEGSEVKLRHLVRSLVGLADVVNVALINEEQDALCTGVAVYEEDDEVVEATRRYVDKELSGPPYKTKPRDGREYVAGPGGFYPVPTHDDLDDAEREFAEHRAPVTGLSLVEGGGKRDAKAPE